MKLYLEDGETIPAVQILPDVDPAPSGYTLSTSIEDWDTYWSRGVSSIVARVSISALVATKTFALCTAGEKAVASKWFVVSKTDRDTVHTAAEQAANSLITYPIEEEMTISCSDEDEVIATGLKKASFRSYCNLYIEEIRASLSEVSTSGAVTVDVNVDGTTVLSTKLTIDQDEKSSVTAAAAAVLSEMVINDDDEVVIDIDGHGAGAEGLKVSLIMRHMKH